MSTICLGMSLRLLHLEMAGWGVFIAPNTKLAVGGKLLLLCGTPDSPVVGTRRSGAPVRCPLAVACVSRPLDCKLLHRTVRCHTGQSVPPP
jgi:hypothetical protein